MKSGKSLKEESASIGLTLRVIDCLSIVTAGLISYYWYFDKLAVDSVYKIGFLLSVLILEFIAASMGAYKAWRVSSFTSELRLTVISFGITFLLLLMTAFFTHTFTLLPRIWIMSWLLLSIFLTLILRVGLRYGLGLMYLKGHGVKRILIVGGGELANHVANRLLEHRALGLMPIGFVNDTSEAVNTSTLKVIGSIHNINALVRKNEIDQVWITLPISEVKTMERIQTALSTSPVTIRMVPDIYGFYLLNHSVSEVSGLPIINLSTSAMLEGKNRIIKYLEDRILAALILLLISPVLITIALSVKLSSKGPIFYRQERVSWNGKPFQMLKFRSMSTDSEKGGVCWGNSTEKSVTTFGRFIRKTSLDELPQFINVLKGDMSIVGPRPERTVFVTQFKDEIPGYMQKHMMKAGITGWAQINGWRGDTDLKKRIEHDLYYIENWTPWFDLKIIILTIWKGFIHTNAK